MRKFSDPPSSSLTPLERAPSRLSTDEVEQALGLPSGAWRRRRLYALKARSSAFRAIGVLRGDSLIVEPGERLRACQLVVVKEGGRVAVRRADSLTAGDPGQTSLLPYMGIRAHVIGTVVGILRRDAGGKLKTVPLSASASRSLSTKNKRENSQRLEAAQAGEECARVERQLRAWNLWTKRNQSLLRAFAPSSIETCDRMAARLGTLLECMRLAHGPRLRKALFREAQAVGAEMDRLRGSILRAGRRSPMPTQGWRPPTQADCAYSG